MSSFVERPSHTINPNMSTTTKATAPTTAPPPTKPPRTFSLILLGDLQLGRLIDALLPTSINRLSPHTDPESAAKTVDEYIVPRNPELREYGYAGPWGDALDLIRGNGDDHRKGQGKGSGGSGSGSGSVRADLVLANLETALTTSESKWRDKAFNFRSHPANVRVLVEAGFAESKLGPNGIRKSRGYVSLANNHVLDWGLQGMEETVRTLEESGIACAGAGRDAREAERGARLWLGGSGADAESEAEAEAESNSGSVCDNGKGEGCHRGDSRRYEVRCFSFSDHPHDWAGIDGFNYFDYTQQSRERMKRIITAKPEPGCPEPSLLIVSLHWGSNYVWTPSAQIQSLAHFLIDHCAVDLIHGHSSHHIQGVEVYHGKLIVYGCGDFVDDYAVVSGGWRNDLGAVWRVSVCKGGGDGGSDVGKGDGVDEVAGNNDSERKKMEGRQLRISKLEVFPNRIQSFAAHLLDRDDEDHVWLQRKFRDLCEGLGTKVERELGEQGQIVIDVEGQ